MNKLEICMIGMQRSGNHAIADWILQQFENPVFLNHVVPFEDPFNHRRTRGSNDRESDKTLLLYSYENLSV